MVSSTRSSNLPQKRLKKVNNPIRSGRQKLKHHVSIHKDVLGADSLLILVSEYILICFYTDRS